MKERARYLRQEQTRAETRLCHALRNRSFLNFKFRRQRVIGAYIVDFVCLKSKLILELDGSQHLQNQEYDAIRTDYLQACGYQVLRFWNNQVLEELDSLLNTIFIYILCSS